MIFVIEMVVYCVNHLKVDSNVVNKVVIVWLVY